MSELASEPRRDERRVPENPGEAVAAVVEDLGRLARAELRLAATEARAWLTRIGFGLALLWLSLLLVQVFVCLVALSPLLLAGHPWPTVALSLALSLSMAAGTSLFAVRELRRLKDVGNERQPERH
jgi:Putative Actinobacterial Holin-X, holin superfamily III